MSDYPDIFPVWGVRLALQDVAGIDEGMIDSLLAGRPFTSIADLRQRSALSAPVAEALAHAGALDSLSEHSRRDILLETSERWAATTGPDRPSLLPSGPPAGLPDYTLVERVRAELEVLGLDASAHVISFYDPLLDRLGVTRAGDLLDCRSGQRVRIAGVKVATQTPPVRSGQRVIFLSLDDATGVSDSAFFESVHDRCAATVFSSWLLVVDGRVRRSGARGVSITAESAWDLTGLMQAWQAGALEQALVGERRAPGATAPRRLWHASGGSAGG